MKKFISYISIAIASVCVLASCGDNAATMDYGFPLIYIPQATVTGLDNTYPIPNGPFGQNSAYTCYFKDGKLNIEIGVIRSGFIQNSQAFSVNLGVSQDQTAKKLAEYAEKGIPAVQLAADKYTLPAKIQVEAGKNGGNCYIPVDLSSISPASIFEDGVYKLLVLGVEISSPSAYELAKKNTSAVIVIDLNHSAWDNAPAGSEEAKVRRMFPLE